MIEDAFDNFLAYHLQRRAIYHDVWFCRVCAYAGTEAPFYPYRDGTSICRHCGHVGCVESVCTPALLNDTPTGIFSVSEIEDELAVVAAIIKCRGRNAAVSVIRWPEARALQFSVREKGQHAREGFIFAITEQEFLTDDASDLRSFLTCMEPSIGDTNPLREIRRVAEPVRLEDRLCRLLCNKIND